MNRGLHSAVRPAIREYLFYGQLRYHSYQLLQTNTSEMSSDVSHVRETFDAPSIAVIQAVSSRKDVDESELPPLQDTIDTDALDALFTNWPDQSSQLDRHVRFQYCGYTVFVHSDGYVTTETV